MISGNNMGFQNKIIIKDSDEIIGINKKSSNESHDCYKVFVIVFFPLRFSEAIPRILVYDESYLDKRKRISELTEFHCESDTNQGSYE